jgi:protein O-mannosyl-transferase
VRTNNLYLFPLAVLVVCCIFATLTRNGVYRNNIALWTDAVLKSPQNQRARYNLGYAFFKAGMHEASLREHRALVADGAEPEAGVSPRHIYLQMGISTFYLGRYDEAIAYWKKGLSYDAPDEAELLTNIAAALLKKKKVREALQYARDAVNRDPRLSEAQINLGDVYIATHEYARALSCFEQAIAVDPSAAEAYLKSAQMYEKLGQYQEAVTSGEKFITLEQDPGLQEEARALIARLRGRTGQPRQAGP